MSKVKFVPYRTIRRCKGIEYYFDDDGILKSKNMEYCQDSINLVDTFSIETENENMFLKGMSFKYINLLALRKAIARLEVGDSIQKFEEIIDNVRIEHHEKKKGIERFITKIEKPIFERIPENENKNTFDFIRVDINIIKNFEGKRKYIREHHNEICNMVLRKIEKDNRFLKYGIPINFLKIEKATLILRMNIIEFLFSIKEI